MRAFCPSCHKEGHVETAAAACEKCGTHLVLDGKYILTAPPSTGHAADEVDGAFPIRAGEDIRTRDRVAIRIAALDVAARLDREATILKGLTLPGVPRVLSTVDVPGVGRALVMTHPAGRTLEQALSDGLRTNSDGARAFLDGILRLIAQLHALSPPVFHRNLHPGTIFWDGSVAIWDFARATDTAHDARADQVLARPGYFPSTDRIHAPVQQELYSVGATVIHILARQSPEQIPSKNGIPDYRPLVRIDDGLAEFIDRLLGARRPFHSAQEALDTLRTIERRSSSTPAVVVLLAGLVAAGAGLVVMVKPAPTPIVPPMTTLQPPPVPAPPVPPVPPSTPQDMELQVISQPAGADVLIDGLHSGKTPLTTTVILNRSITVEVRKAGFIAQQEQVTMDRAHVLRWTLKPEPRPTPEPPPPQPIVVKSDDGVQKELKKLIEARAADLKACNVEGTDRVRFTIGLDEKGGIGSAEPNGRSQLKTSSCVAVVLKGISSSSLKGGGALSADVWIYFAPAFKVAVY